MNNEKPRDIVDTKDSKITLVCPPPDPVAAAWLYGELRELAQKDVEGAVIARLGANNAISVGRVALSADYSTGAHSAIALFTINGQPFRVEAIADRLDNDVLRVFADKLHREIMFKLQGQMNDITAF